MKIKTMVTESLYSNNIVKLTDAQWRLYYYFLSICEDNFICKQNLKIKHCCEILNLTKQTYYNAIKALLKYNLITDYNDSIVINESTDDFVDIEMSVLKVLLHFSKTADLIRLYLMFLKFGNTKIKYFTKRKIADLLGHNSSNEECYKSAEHCLNILQDLKLIDLTVEEKKCCGKSYNSYIVNKVYETNDYFKSDKLKDILNNIPNEIKQKYIQGPSD